MVSGSVCGLSSEVDGRNTCSEGVSKPGAFKASTIMLSIFDKGPPTARRELSYKTTIDAFGENPKTPQIEHLALDEVTDR